jgi:hypothetical protein
VRLFIHQGAVFHRTYNRVGDALWDPPLDQALPQASAEHGIPAGEIMVYTTADPAEAEALLNAPLAALVPTVAGGQVTGVAVDPAWSPPAPPPDPLQALQADVARVEQVVAKTLPVSPHDRRFLTQKEIGKTIIPWIKANPDCTPEQAETQIVALILAELPGEPVVPKLYWEHEGQPQGLAMSYLYEAIKRGYCPPETPLTWASLVGLVVATPEEMIAAWLRSL